MSVSEHTITNDPNTGEPRLRIERLHAEHIPILLPLEHGSYPDPWTQGMFRQEIANIHSYFYVAFLDEKLVGYTGFWLVADEAHITKVTIDEERRGCGLGSELMIFLLDKGIQLRATTFRLEVRQSNETARRLYQRLGFTEIGKREGYYTKSKETAIVMQRPAKTKETPPGGDS